MKRLVIFIVMNILFLNHAQSGIFNSTFPGKDPQKIKNCSTEAEDTIQEALDFLEDRLDIIMESQNTQARKYNEKFPELVNKKYPVEQLSQKDMKNIRKNFKSLNVRCSDYKMVCTKSTGVVGATNIFSAYYSPTIQVCYNKIKAKKERAFCELVQTISHELGHASRVKRWSNHNQGPMGKNKKLNMDKVYSLGRYSKAVCDYLGLDRTIPTNLK